jgi:hypothetical protein
VHIPPGVEEHNCSRSVGLPDTFYLTGNGIKSLIPGNPLEFTFAALAYSLQGILKAVGSVNPLAICPSLQAGFYFVISLDFGNYPVFDMEFEGAGAIAMAAADSQDYFFSIV